MTPRLYLIIWSGRDLVLAYTDALFCKDTLGCAELLSSQTVTLRAMLAVRVSVKNCALALRCLSTAANSQSFSPSRELQIVQAALVGFCNRI